MNVSILITTQFYTVVMQLTAINAIYHVNEFFSGLSEENGWVIIMFV